jgi:phosphatidylglycerophosphate synthase
VTNFGKLMDPLADKLLIIAALVALVSLGYGMVLVTVVSGVDFVFGLRRRLSEAEAARATRKSAAESGA